MSIEINVPDIGADEVEITEILVKVGDKVEAEQSLITVEGDKASMEVPSPQAGVVKEIKVAVGDKTETGKLIMIFEVAGAAPAAAAAPAAKADAAPARPPRKPPLRLRKLKTKASSPRTRPTCTRLRSFVVWRVNSALTWRK